MAEQQAQQQQQDAQAEQNAGNDVTTLRQDADFSGDLSGLGSDVSQTNDDLAGEKSDAVGGPNADGGDCYNMSGNVDYDAQENVEYDAQEDLGYDLSENLKPDMATVRSDIAAVRGDLSGLADSGLPTPADADDSIATAQAAIRHAIDVANEDVGVVNADVDEAYTIARDMATGSCSGEGPGSTPAPVKTLG